MGEAKKHNPSWLEDGDMTVGMDGVTAMLDELYLSEPDEDSSNRALARVSEAGRFSALSVCNLTPSAVAALSLLQPRPTI